MSRCDALSALRGGGASQTDALMTRLTVPFLTLHDCASGTEAVSSIHARYARHTIPQCWVPQIQTHLSPGGGEGPATPRSARRAAGRSGARGGACCSAQGAPASGDPAPGPPRYTGTRGALDTPRSRRQGQREQRPRSDEREVNRKGSRESPAGAESGVPRVSFSVRVRRGAVDSRHSAHARSGVPDSVTLHGQHTLLLILPRDM